tara:strand:- start:3806 stop:5311 length:1506 start_codon:yes stop_codon:yes gene_type:complete
MGLFSGSFGTGLASGLATSVDKSMTDAMDKRDKDMTRARSFWETRQAQKQDIAEEETKRAKKSYDRLVKEFGGSTVKALAAYKAIGGSADTVETYIARLDDSRVADRNYNINDMFKFDNIKLEDYADFTREQAYEDIKTSVSAPDITYKEAPSILTTLGFGRDEKAVSKNIAGQVESLLPSSERVDSGIMAADTPVNIYRGMQDTPIEKTFQAQIVRINSELSGLEVGTDEHTNKLAEYNSVIKKATEYTIAMSNPPRDSATVSNLLNGYTTQIASVESNMGYGQRGETYTATIAGEMVIGTKALEERNKRVEATTRSYIRTNILDEKTANIIGGVGGVQDTMSKQQGDYFLNLLKEEQEIMRGELAEGDNTVIPSDVSADGPASNTIPFSVKPMVAETFDAAGPAGEAPTKVNRELTNKRIAAKPAVYFGRVIENKGSLPTKGDLELYRSAIVTASRQANPDDLDYMHDLFASRAIEDIKNTTIYKDLLKKDIDKQLGIK